MKYSIYTLLRDIEAGEKVKYLFFWGHQPQKNGAIGQGCLSQWWPVRFEVGGDMYASSEHYMMAEKARLFDDEAIRQQILMANTPAEAKALGRKVQGFDDEVWNRERFGIVVRGNVAKFSQHDDLKQYLKNTKKRILVEASPVDTIWGIGLSKEATKVHIPDEWRGLNLLGFALMEVRDQLSL